MTVGSINYLELNDIEKQNFILKFQLNGIYFGTKSSTLYSLKRKNADFIEILDLFIILKFHNSILFN